MTKLFMVYIGGTAGNCNIEVHDIRFVTGERIEDTYQQLRQQWYGHGKGLHLDSYMQVTNIDGYKIEISSTPANQKEKLFFVNLGGYKPDSLAEQHEFGLFVAESKRDACEKAKRVLLINSLQQHKDDVFDIDDCFAVELASQNQFIHLTESGLSQKIKPDWFGYEVIG